MIDYYYLFVFFKLVYYLIIFINVFHIKTLETTIKLNNRYEFRILKSCIQFNMIYSIIIIYLIYVLWDIYYLFNIYNL